MSCLRQDTSWQSLYPVAEQQFQKLSCVHYTIFSVVKLDLYLRALKKRFISTCTEKNYAYASHTSCSSSPCFSLSIFHLSLLLPLLFHLSPTQLVVLLSWRDTDTQLVHLHLQWSSYNSMWSLTALQTDLLTCLIKLYPLTVSCMGVVI